MLGPRKACGMRCRKTLIDLGMTNDWQHKYSRAPRFAAISQQRAKWGASEVFGRSRSDFTSKVHASGNNQGLPVGFILNGGEASDRAAAEPLKALPLPQPKRKALLAGNGYDGDRLREGLLIRSIPPIVPPHSNCVAPERPDYQRCKVSNWVARMFGKFKQQRRIAHAMTNPTCRSRASSSSMHRASGSVFCELSQAWPQISERSLHCAFSLPKRATHHCA